MPGPKVTTSRDAYGPRQNAAALSSGAGCRSSPSCHEDNCTNRTATTVTEGVCESCGTAPRSSTAAGGAQSVGRRQTLPIDTGDDSRRGLRGGDPATPRGYPGTRPRRPRGQWDGGRAGPGRRRTDHAGRPHLGAGRRLAPPRRRRASGHLCRRAPQNRTELERMSEVWGHGRAGEGETRTGAQFAGVPTRHAEHAIVDPPSRQSNRESRRKTRSQPS